MDNQQYDNLDMLGIFSAFLGVLNYIENLKQSSNDDIVDELHDQNEKFLMKIIEQNEKIIKLLEGKENGSNKS